MFYYDGNQPVYDSLVQLYFLIDIQQNEDFESFFSENADLFAQIIFLAHISHLLEWLQL